MNRLLFLPFLLFFLLCPSEAAPSGTHKHHQSHVEDDDVQVSDGNSTKRIQMVAFKWLSVEAPYVIAAWLLVSSIAKLVFNGNLKSLTHVFPESSLLIVLGLVIGYFLMISDVDHLRFTLDSHAFFLYLLPPIIFDAGYFMPNRAFFQNWDSILLFAVVGTIFNTLCIGGSLYALSYFQIFTKQFDVFEILLFSSLISAVDPVAVIAVFEEIHVNDFIFVNVFGEALFNDGVTVVLYELFKQFLQLENIKNVDIAAGAGSFVIVACGGVVVGLIFAIFVSLLTKHSDHVRILAPLFIFLVPYMGYLTAEMLSLSPIIAIAVCGMAMKQYVKGNMTTTASNSVKYFTKMLAQSSETVIFLFLGLSTITSTHWWDTRFVLFTILACIVFRTTGVVFQCALLNKLRGKKFTKVDQFILSYGGLRGAIAFGLAVSMPEDIEAKSMFVTTTIAVIFFTVFLQGSTIRPLVNFLNVETKVEEEPTMAESVFGKYMDYLVSGIEDITGQKGHHSLVHDFERFNSKVIAPVLMREHAMTRDFDATKIIRAYAQILLKEAMASTAPKRSLSTRSDSTVANCQCTVTKQFAGKHSANCPMSPTNMEALYGVFESMLNSKLEELRRELTVKEGKDIEDDYMSQVNVLSSMRGSTTNITDNASIQRRALTTSMSLALPIEHRRARTDGGIDLETPKRLTFD